MNKFERYVFKKIIKKKARDISASIKKKIVGSPPILNKRVLFKEESLNFRI